MLPELGSFSILLALSFALIQIVCRPTFKVNAVIGQFAFLSFALFLLIVCFLKNDMSVWYVQQHSHSTLPLIYRIGAAWGGHEGSLLLWCLILSGWTFLFSLYSLLLHSSKSVIADSTFFNKIMSILGLLSTGFIIFLYFTSNPFARIFPTSLIIGEDLAPVLQDPGLIFHPPMLYSGYVGFAISFAFAVAALLENKLEPRWAKVWQPWVILPWCFLSCGIVLGSWWAYRELGWGGWWFWDPVENASLLPWLAATALMHSLIVVEKQDVFKGWTIFLGILTFTLSLIGTFLVRSGVLVSVHAFASDPTRGLFLLAFLTCVIGGAFLLYAYKIKYFYKSPTFTLFSRETFLLFNSIFLLACVLTVLLGTLYPILLESLSTEKISIGEPYFNIVFLPIILPLLLLMGFAPHVRWQQQNFKQLISQLNITFCISLFVGFAAPIFFGFPFTLFASVGIFLSVWVILATVQYAFRLENKWRLKAWSMIFAHIGIGMMGLAISVNKNYSAENQIKLSVGETYQFAGNAIKFAKVTEESIANYKTTLAIFDITANDTNTRTYHLAAEQRIYKAHDQLLSIPGILANPFRDLYISLGNAFSKDTWTIRIYYKPLVRWIWWSGILIVIGGIFSLLAFLRGISFANYFVARKRS